MIGCHLTIECWNVYENELYPAVMLSGATLTDESAHPFHGVKLCMSVRLRACVQQRVSDVVDTVHCDLGVAICTIRCEEFP